jgi:hypothetical protein
MSTVTVNVAVSNSNFVLPSLTVAQRQTLSSVVQGTMIYNSDWDTVEFYDGTNWLDASILT